MPGEQKMAADGENAEKTKGGNHLAVITRGNISF